LDVFDFHWHRRFDLFLFHATTLERIRNGPVSLRLLHPMPYS
jgi:hypothetical protein